MQKYKLKSAKSITKRFKRTATGVYIRRKACRSHLLQKKTASCKQKLRKVAKVKEVNSSLWKSIVFSFK